MSWLWAFAMTRPFIKRHRFFCKEAVFFLVSNKHLKAPINELSRLFAESDFLFIKQFLLMLELFLGNLSVILIVL